jgi:hypothetical protein
MTHRWLAAALIFGLLACGPAKADVIYTFLDSDPDLGVDLEFSVDAQLSPANSPQAFDSLGGLYGPNFAGGQVRFNLTPARELQFVGADISGVFIFFAGVPGNGHFGGSGIIYDRPDLTGVPLAGLGEMTVSGAPVGASVPEPVIWALLSLGFLGLAALRVRSKRGVRLC